MVETLESRRLFAVTAFVDDGVLIVRGSAGDDTATIVRGVDFTTFQFTSSSNGLSFAQVLTFSDVTRGIRIDMGDGDDTVTLQATRVFGTVEIDGGTGSDQLIVRSARISGHFI